MEATYYVNQYGMRTTEGQFALTIAEIVELAKLYGPIKIYNEEGFLRGTVYPNGEVQR